MKAAFAAPRTDEERELAAIIAEGEAEQASALEAELFRQKTRLANAERSLQGKITKKTENEQRIARDKMDRAQRNLADIRRKEWEPRDSRIYPGEYAPVMIEREGKRVVVPMRYQCRLAGGTKRRSASILARTTRAGTISKRRGPSCSATGTASWS